MKIIKSKRLDHLGIVAGTLQELGIIDWVDSRFEPEKDCKVSTGRVIAALVLNGLGLVSRPLSLTPQFFETKALDILLGAELEPEDLNRHRLGRALDDIHAYGCELLFSEIAQRVCKQAGVDCTFTSLDTTSFSVTGEYAEDTDENTIKMMHGYSKDHRPDLKQAILELVVSQDGGFPLMMHCFSGNASDNKIFKARCAQLVKCFKNSDAPHYVVGDSKLYHADNAPHLRELSFVTRIPRSYAEEQMAVKKAWEVSDWQPVDEANRYYEYRIRHFEMDQRWMVVHSQAAQKRANKVLYRKTDQEYKKAVADLKHLRNTDFACASDAQAAAERLNRAFQFHEIILTDPAPYDYYAAPGRPKKTDFPTHTVYRVTGTIIGLFKQRKAYLEQKSCYVIGTNTTSKTLDAGQVIEAYKNQNASVESGFRFLKDPQFFTASFFIKKPSRIMALLMIMTLSLLVYSVAQRHLRQQLIKKNETLPNQINQPTQKPTLRWVFQLMEGIDVIYIKTDYAVQRLISGLKDIHQKIIRFFFKPIRLMYQIE